MKSVQVFKIEFKNGTVARSHFIEGSSFILGRGETSAIQIQDENVSREHLKIIIDDAIGICIQDLGSANGTFVKHKKVESKLLVPINANDLIELGKSKVSFKVSLFSIEKKTENLVKDLSDEKKINEIKVDIKGYPESEHSIKLDFKNVGLDVPKYKDANEHSVEILKEAEFIKHSILKNAEAQKEKILNDTREESKKIADLTYQKYLKNAQHLLQETKKRIEHLKIETRADLDQKQIYAHKEIEMLWQKHHDGVDIEKNSLLSTLKQENENQLQLDLESQRNLIFVEKEKQINLTEKALFDLEVAHQKSLEKTYVEFKNKNIDDMNDIKLQLIDVQRRTELHLKERRKAALTEIEHLWKMHTEQTEQEKINILKTLQKENQIKLDYELQKIEKDMLLQKEQLLRDSDLDIEIKTKKYRAQFEIEQSEHQEKIRFFSLQIENLEKDREQLISVNSNLQIAKSEFESQIDHLNSQIKTYTEQHHLVQKQFEALNSEYKEKIIALDNFKKNKDQLLLQTDQLKTESESLTKSLSILSQKKNTIESEIVNLNENLAQTKTKNKLEVEYEFSSLKKTEQKKFDDFKSHELKELQKIREQHSESIKKLSIDLSQEIATTLELESKKSTATAAYDFEKNFGLINSIIQVKSSAIAGSTPKHQLQLDNWRKRQQMEKTKLIVSGFAAAFVFYFSGHFVYSKLTQDSFQSDMQQITADRQKKELENVYVVTKTTDFHDDYVKSTIYTQNFADAYLNEANQKEWVRHATMHFLNKWKVSEENTIKVISNSKALVQNIQDEIPKLKKDRIKADLEKLAQTEKINTDAQAQILGTYVKYEAYRKLEKDFFLKKMNQRNMATEK
jgi:pSer/pThr/pTyr-binding forkhead associated (FHA) protein